MDRCVYSWKNGWGWSAISWEGKGFTGLTFGHADKSESIERVAANVESMQVKALLISNIDKLPDWVRDTVDDINSYLNGNCRTFHAHALCGRYTAFQKAVWAATSKIPYGETRPYSWVAEKAGSAGATRAAGSALGANPLPLIVPCHRVIRADGSLGGFGLGLDIKKKLLELERANK